jgi:hypothetical protein
LQQRGPHFVGFVSLALALLAIAQVLRDRRATETTGALEPRIWVPAAAAIALVLVVLSLGPDVTVWGTRLGPGPYRLLYAWVPGFQLVRIPERLALLAMLFVGLLAGRAVRLVETRSRVVALVLAALVPLEHVGPLPVRERVPVGRDIPEAERMLATAPVHALAEVPIHGEGLVPRETEEMYFSAYHFRPIIHGYTAYPPLLSRLLRRLAARFPAETALQAFQRVGVDTVVVHHGRPLGADLARRLRETGRSDPELLHRLLHRAELDLFDRLPAAVAAGRIAREARLSGESARLYESTADEIYRVRPAPAHAAAPFPTGHRLRDPAWHYRTKVGDPAPAADGDLGTSWTVPRFLLGDEFFEVTFDRPQRVAGLVLPLRRDSVFPTEFRVAGREPGGPWIELARLDEAHLLQLLDRLRTDPRQAALGFDLGDRELVGVSLLVDEAGTSFDGWSLPEVEVWVPDSAGAR